MLVTISVRIIKADLWDAIYTACKNVNSKDIETPTNSLELQTCPYYVLLVSIIANSNFFNRST